MITAAAYFPDALHIFTSLYPHAPFVVSILLAM
jgi:hypothetical protein